MIFSSVVFLFYYLPFVLAIYYLAPRKYRNIWLFIVNLVFYGWGEPVYILLMLFSIALNYTSGRLVNYWREKNKKRARRVLACNTTLNLLLLIVFKYADLIVSTIDQLTGASLPLPGLGSPWHPASRQARAPVGPSLRRRAASGVRRGLPFVCSPPPLP